MGTRATKEEIAGHAVRTHRLFEKFRDGGLRWTAKEVNNMIQDLSDNKVPCIFQSVTAVLNGPILNDEGIVTVFYNADHDKTDNELVVEARANYPDWWFKV